MKGYLCRARTILGGNALDVTNHTSVVEESGKAVSLICA